MPPRRPPSPATSAGATATATPTATSPSTPRSADRITYPTLLDTALGVRGEPLGQHRSDPLGDHDGRDVGGHARDCREDRGVGDGKSLDAVNSTVGVDDGGRVVVPPHPHRATAVVVMRGRPPDRVRQVLVVDVRTWH